MNKKMVFFDIDGTLIEVNKGIYKILPEVEKAMDRLKENGHDVFLATGRCQCFIVDGVSYYPFSGAVTCNGSRVDYHNVCVFKSVIPAEAILATMKVCSRYNMNYYFEASDRIYVKDNADPFHIEFAHKWGMKLATCEDHFDPSKIETYVGMIYCHNLDEIPAMKEALSHYFLIQRHRSAHSFDLTLRGTSKALGIQELVKRLHRSMADTIAFGDGRNDLEMISNAGIGIAMGNAVPELKDVANYVTDDIDKHGIINALKHFSLV